jgi:hypothetical protein
MLPSSLTGMLAKQLQPMMERMQKDIVRIQNELDKERLEVSSGGGMVKVVISGMGEILEIKLDPDVVDPNEVEMLQDLIAAAVREAMKKAEARHRERMAEATGGLSLPPGIFGY